MSMAPAFPDPTSHLLRWMSHETRLRELLNEARMSWRRCMQFVSPAFEYDLVYKGPDTVRDGHLEYIAVCQNTTRIGAPPDAGWSSVWISNRQMVQHVRANANYPVRINVPAGRVVPRDRNEIILGTEKIRSLLQSITDQAAVLSSHAIVLLCTTSPFKLPLIDTPDRSAITDRLTTVGPTGQAPSKPFE